MIKILCAFLVVLRSQINLVGEMNIISLSNLVSCRTEELDKIPKTVPLIFSQLNNDLPFLMIKHFLSPSQCDQIMTDIHYNLKNANELVYSSTDINNSSSYRKVLIVSINSNYEKLYRSRWDYFQKNIESFFDGNYVSSEGFQTLIYTKGCKYKLHSDNCSHYYDQAFKFLKWVHDHPLRVISTVLFLSDYVDLVTDFNQFSGGKLKFNYLINKVTNQNLLITPQKGLLIAFPSHPYFAHEVTLLKDGLRGTIVDWHNFSVTNEK